MTQNRQPSQIIQEAVDPFVKPREQASYIRRVLALHLDSSCDPGIVKRPLSLIEAGCQPRPSVANASLHKDYLEALTANANALRSYQDLRRIEEPTTQEHDAGDQSTLTDHLQLIELREKRERLRTIEKYLDSIAKLPAASQTFIDPDDVFADCPALPHVPRTVVEGFAAEAAGAKADLNELGNRLERVALRARLLLKHEEELLQEVRQSSGDLDGVSGARRLSALDATRIELIAWIEKELSKTSEGDGGDDGREVNGPDGGPARLSTRNTGGVFEQLELVRQKYATYVSSRKALVAALTSRPPAPLAIEEVENPADEEVMAASADLHLIIPYLENLSAVSRAQKDAISHKSTLNISLAKQVKDTCLAIDHLAEESQLLPRFPSKGKMAKLRLGDDLGSGASEKPDTTARVKPWVHAADSAKISNLEAVMESVEEGQAALEGCMKAMKEINRLFGVEERSGKEWVGEVDEGEDIWLPSDVPSSKGSGRGRSQKGAKGEVRDIWTSIDGSLGLIGQNDQA